MSAIGGTEMELALGGVTPVLIEEETKIWRHPGVERKARPKLQIINVSKSFPVAGGRIQAIQNINLTVNAGELVSLVGPSGCGKTTLLNIIAGLEKPDFGEIKSWTETGVAHTSPGERLLIFQENSLFPWLTVYDNVAFGLKLRKIPSGSRRQIVEKYLNLVQLGKFQDACIHQLSGGMKQRAALARALVLEPEILLMDEPFAALDVQTRRDMYNLLLDIREKTGKTILFITHNVDEALILSNRILMMTPHPGRVKREIEMTMEYPRRLESHGLQHLRQEIFREFACGEEKNPPGGVGT